MFKCFLQSYTFYVDNTGNYGVFLFFLIMCATCLRIVTLKQRHTLV